MSRWGRSGVAAVALLMLAGCATEPEMTPQRVTIDPGWEMLTVDTSFSSAWEEPFIKLVDLGRLRVGMTKQEVLAIFPNPDETELRGRDELWDYGFAELIFRGNLLSDWFNR